MSRRIVSRSADRLGPKPARGLRHHQRSVMTGGEVVCVEGVDAGRHCASRPDRPLVGRERVRIRIARPLAAQTYPIKPSCLDNPKFVDDLPMPVIFRA